MTKPIWQRGWEMFIEETDVVLMVTQVIDGSWIFQAVDVADAESMDIQGSFHQDYMTDEDARDAALDWYTNTWLPYYQQTGERMLP